MKIRYRYILKIKLSRVKSDSSNCDLCHFKTLCENSTVNLYTSGLFSQEKAQRILDSDTYFRITRIYEDI
jgi:hypothetical protein